MAARDTSIEAYNRQIYLGRMSATEQRVFDCVKEHGSCTRMDIANLLETPINRITSPVFNLVKAGILEEHERVIQPETGSKAWAIRVKEVQ